MVVVTRLLVSQDSKVPYQIYFLVILRNPLYLIEFGFLTSVQVDKQEKKKKKTGRAKRRMQYNRRFVNVVAGFGKRRGPNSNAP